MARIANCARKGVPLRIFGGTALKSESVYKVLEDTVSVLEHKIPILPSVPEGWSRSHKHSNVNEDYDDDDAVDAGTVESVDSPCSAKSRMSSTPDTTAEARPKWQFKYYRTRNKTQSALQASVLHMSLATCMHHGQSHTNIYNVTIQPTAVVRVVMSSSANIHA